MNRRQSANLLVYSLLVLLPIKSVFGQIGFNFYNQRNHPELRWHVLETAHFKIIFHQRLASLAIDAANIAEASLETLTANLNHLPTEKIPIYLSDQDEIANGFDVSNRYIVIWVNANQYVDTTTGTDKWLRKVIAHELVHYLHFSKISTWAGFWGHAFTGTPRWFVEGLAQYASETWNVHRGDLILRTRVLEDEMDYTAFQSPTDGAMLYATGNSAVRYLAQKYGDSTLVDLLEHRSRVIFPYYNFNKAFKQVLGKSPNMFLKEWRKQVNIYYNSVYAQKEEIEIFGHRIQLPFQYIQDFKISPDSTRLAVVGVVSLDDPVARLYLVDAVQHDIIQILENNSVLPGIDFSPDGRRLVYAKYHRGANGSLIPGIILTDLKGHRRWLTQNERARMPIWSRDGQEIICILNENGTDNLYALTPDAAINRKLTHFSGDTQLSTPRLAPNGQWLAFLHADSSGFRHLLALDLSDAKIVKITNDSTDHRNPVWSPDGNHLAFTSYRTGIPNIFLKNLTTNSPPNWEKIPARQVTDAALGIYLLDWRQDSLFALVLESKQSQQVYRIPAHRGVKENQIQIKSRYAAWQYHRPPFGIPDFQATQTATIEKRYKYNSAKEIRHYFTIPLPLLEESRTGFSFLSYWAEPLAKHQIIGFGEVAVNEPARSRYVVNYVNNQWHPTLAVSAVYFPLEAQFFADEFLIIEKKGINLTGWFPFNFGDDLYSNHTLSAGFSLFRNYLMNPELFETRPLLPGTYRIGEFSLAYQWNWRPPHRWNRIHPLAAKGVKIKTRFADNNWGSQFSYQMYELDGYANQALPGKTHVIFSRLLFQAVQGNLPPPQQPGFDKYDQLDFGFGLPLGDRPRLRGESEYHFGNRVIFGNLEYRFPVIQHLGWYVAGITFGKVTGCGFFDFGAAWYAHETPWLRISFLKTAGFELKNEVNLRIFSFVHEIGWARKLKRQSADTEFYYRIRSVIPF